MNKVILADNKCSGISYDNIDSVDQKPPLAPQRISLALHQN